MKPSYSQLQNKVVFYHVLFIGIVTIIVFDFIGTYGIYNENIELEKQVKIEKVKVDVLREELQKERKQFKDALCLPRIAKFDKELKIS